MSCNDNRPIFNFLVPPALGFRLGILGSNQAEQPDGKESPSSDHRKTRSTASQLSRLPNLLAPYFLHLEGTKINFDIWCIYQIYKEVCRAVRPGLLHLRVLQEAHGEELMERSRLVD